MARRNTTLFTPSATIPASPRRNCRSQLLYATEQAQSLRNSKAQIETCFYEWLLAELPEEERTAFCQTLDTLYHRSKKESRSGFPHMAALLRKEGPEHT